MLRCEFCRGHAHAGLAHLHGLSVHLCEDCTRKVLERRTKEEAICAFKRQLTVIALGLASERSKECVDQRKAA